MNTKIKIALAMLVGLLAGAMLVGTAFAVPRMMSLTTDGAYRMMRGFDARDTLARPSAADMNRFMDSYRTSDGSVDYSRMYADVNSGEVTPPCVTGRASARGARTMMGGYDDRAGYGMMGSVY